MEYKNVFRILSSDFNEIQKHVNAMEILNIEIKGDEALKELHNLEQQDLILIVKEPDSNLYSLPGGPISNEDFANWIEFAENSPNLSLIQAKQKWEDQKRILKNSIL